MWNKTKRIAISIAVVVGTYFLYTVLVVPWIEPNLRRRPGDDQTYLTPDIVGQQKEFLAKLFPPGSWQLGRTKVLESNRIMLLMRDFKELESNRLRLEPVTILVFSTDDRQQRLNEPPLILEGKEAVLHFSELNLSFGKIGQLDGGRLDGEVTIRREPSSPKAMNGVAIKTRDVDLHPGWIETKAPIQFRYGGSSGSGRHLIAKLDESEKKPGQSTSAIGGLQSLQLNHVDRIQIALQNGLSDSIGAGPNAGNESSAPLEITCNGPFLFDAALKIASFRERVVVTRPTAATTPDQLRGDLIEIYFTEEDQVAAAKPATDDSESASKLKVQRLVAVGAPATLQAPSAGARASAKQFIYDVVRRRIEASGDQNTELAKDQWVVRSPNVQYEMAENSRELGRLWAAGPGTFHGNLGKDNKSGDAITVGWRDQLRVEPNDSGEHVMTLAGDVSAGVEGRGELQADNLYIWIRSLGIPGKRDKQLLADRMHASGRVNIRSPQLNGKTKELKAWFQYPELNAALTLDQPDAQTMSIVRGEPNTAIPTQTGSPVTLRRNSQPSPLKPMAIGGQVEPTQPPTTKFDMTGDLIQLVFMRMAEEMLVENATISGHVEVKETLSTEPNKPPLVVTGDVIQIEHASSPNAYAHVVGAPGMISGRGIQLFSNHLQMDQARNRVFSQGPGELLLPMDRDFEGRKLALPEIYTVTWQGSLEVIGDRIIFDRNVAVRGRPMQFQKGRLGMVTEQRQLNTGRLEVVLDQSIDFRQLGQSRNPSVRRIECKQGFNAYNPTVQQGKLLSLDEMKADNLSIDHQTGDILVSGAGSARSTRFGFVGLETKLQPTGAPAPSSEQLTFVEVNFRQGVMGNIYRRQIAFRDVHPAIYGPVSNWGDSIAANALQGMRETDVELTCEELTIAQIKSPGGAAESIEMMAVGNANVRGRLFSATGERFTYSNSKEMIVLHGSGRSAAQLSYQQQLGAPRQTASAGTIHFWPKEHRFEASNGRSIEVSNLPN
ncbi:hypothetical protein [Blastopirellula marina]|uniref:Organic solvent tolerance-like N-terminal domain-containing protein n=1 Tax=Blastopirellula marina DSM 3645 TaxID=314230 RepID=A3ZL95_9BACT|nr:hypothetical protein [Blastopirellula marina]EAQ82528.1 hypothetical protein DSM3645_09022 [Blastopirellula marina DSM 3645]